MTAYTNYTVIGVYFNTMTTTFGNIKTCIVSQLPSFNVYAYHVCHGKRGVIILKEGRVNAEDLFQNVVVHFTDIYAEHGIKDKRSLNGPEPKNFNITHLEI